MIPLSRQNNKFRDTLKGWETSELFYLELLTSYIAVDGVVRGRGTNNAPIEDQTVKKLGYGPSYLGIGRAQRERRGVSPISVKRRVWWRIVIF